MTEPIVWTPEERAEALRLSAASTAAWKMLEAAEEGRLLMKGDPGARREQQRAERRYEAAVDAMAEFCGRMNRRADAAKTA